LNTAISHNRSGCNSDKSYACEHVVRDFNLFELSR
jgi:hypothetical protein